MLRRYWYGDHKHGKIVPRSEVAFDLQFNQNTFKNLNRLNQETRKKGSGNMYEVVACSKCYGCKLQYAAEWATLIMLEKLYYPDDECWFLTLTYDDAHIEIPSTITGTWEENLPTGETITHEETFRNDGTWTGTLVEEDMQKFIKRVRKHFPNKEIKYFYCGEYGSETLRPHYHMIIFGAPFNPADFYGHHIDKANHKWHNKSHELDRLWGKSWQVDEETGEIKRDSITDMAMVEWSSASYTARYCMKKVGDTWNDYEWLSRGKIPEFVRMSRTIGDRYYEDHKDEIWKHDNIIMKTVKGNIGSIKPPRKYLRKLEKEDPAKALEIKNRRKRQMEKMYISKEFTDDYNDFEQLIMKAENLQTKAKLLKREL